VKSIFAGILTTVMITVTIGVPIFRHTCNVSDRSELTVLEKKQCCEPCTGSDEAKIGIECCSMQQYDTSFNYETLIKKSTEVSFNLLPIEPAESDIGTYFKQISEPLPVLKPPPVANRDLHKRIQLYLI
jgi:hypothetical protein